MHTLYSLDMLEATRAIGSFIEQLQPPDRHSFVASDLVRSAVLQKLSVIGEAAARVSEQTRAEWPEVPWHQARGIRNILVHAYFSVNWDVVWTTATESIPKLQKQLEHILDALGIKE